MNISFIKGILSNFPFSLLADVRNEVDKFFLTSIWSLNAIFRTFWDLSQAHNDNNDILFVGILSYASFTVHWSSWYIHSHLSVAQHSSLLCRWWDLWFLWPAPHCQALISPVQHWFQILINYRRSRSKCGRLAIRATNGNKDHYNCEVYTFSHIYVKISLWYER